MGGQQSTRKLSIPNDGVTSIRVSQSVVDRLESSLKSPVSKPTTEAKPSVTNESKTSTGQQKIANDLHQYLPTLTSLQVLQSKEEELRESQGYWTNRITQLEAEHKHIGERFEKEYERAIKEIPPPVSPKPAPCTQDKDKVLNCYKKNPKQVLLCAKEVADFAHCIEGKHIC